MTVLEIVRSMSEEQAQHVAAVLTAGDSTERNARIDALLREELQFLISLCEEELKRRKVKYASLAAEAAQEARETFPEFFTGKTDQEIINEIAATVRRAGGEA